MLYIQISSQVVGNEARKTVSLPSVIKYFIWRSFLGGSCNIQECFETLKCIVYESMFTQYNSLKMFLHLLETKCTLMMKLHGVQRIAKNKNETCERAIFEGLMSIQSYCGSA